MYLNISNIYFLSQTHCLIFVLLLFHLLSYDLIFKKKKEKNKAHAVSAEYYATFI